MFGKTIDAFSVLFGVKQATSTHRSTARDVRVGSDPRSIDDVIRQISATYEFYRNYTHLEPDRISVYNDMDEMFQYVLAASALDAYIEDALKVDPRTQRTMWVESANPLIVAELHRLMDNLDFESRIYGDIWNIAKYGDYFTVLRYAPGLGIFDAHPMEPRMVWRHENEKRELIGFTVGDAAKLEAEKKTDPKFKPWDMVQWRIPGRRIVDPYGTPFFWQVRLLYKLLKLMEEQMVLYRMNMHPDRLVFKVFTGSAGPDERRRQIRMWRREIHSQMSLNPDTERLVAENGPWSIDTDIFWPVGEGDNTSNVEKFDGSGNAGDIFDIEYLRDMFFAGIRVPKGYMGFEDSQGYRGDSTLARQSVKFASGVKLLQRYSMVGWIQMFKIHLSLRGFPLNVPENQFTLKMMPVNHLDDQERIETLQMGVEAVQNFMTLGQMMTESGHDIDLKAWATFGLQNYTQIPQTVIDKLMTGRVGTKGGDVVFEPPGGLTFEARYLPEVILEAATLAKQKGQLSEYVHSNMVQGTRSDSVAYSSRSVGLFPPKDVKENSDSFAAALDISDLKQADLVSERRERATNLKEHLRGVAVAAKARTDKERSDK